LNGKKQTKRLGLGAKAHLSEPIRADQNALERAWSEHFRPIF
jgi:hypothetical protein